MHFPEARSSVSDGPGHASLRADPCPLWVSCGQPKNFPTFCSMSGGSHVSGLLVRQIWPLDLMLCADRVPNKPRTLEGVRSLGEFGLRRVAKVQMRTSPSHPTLLDVS